MNDENYDLNSLREKLNERVDEIKKHKDFLNCKFVISYFFPIIFRIFNTI